MEDPCRVEDLESNVFGKDSRITVVSGKFGLLGSLIEGRRNENDVYGYI